MSTSMSSSYSFAAPPARLFALMTDRDFLEGRLKKIGGLDPELVSLEHDQGITTVVTRESIAASALPSMIASLIPGDPVTERTEKWRAQGDGYTADFGVVVRHAPASMKGTMQITPAAAGCTLTVAGDAVVPIPLFGGRIESTIVEQVKTLLAREAAYTTQALAG